MASTTVTLSKFVGTISLGLLTGVSYTLSTTTLPPILALPTAQPAHTTFAHLRALTTRHQLLLSTLSTSSLLLAYLLSPPKGRHPFLLWATLAVGMGYSRDIWNSLTSLMKGKGKGNGGSGNGSPSESGDEEWEVENGSTQSLKAEGGSGNETGLNGEVVREGMERWRGVQVGRTVVFGVGWVVTVVGLWGDRFAGVVA